MFVTLGSNLPCHCEALFSLVIARSEIPRFTRNKLRNLGGAIGIATPRQVGARNAKKSVANHMNEYNLSTV
jgi:hypothetical protein